MQDAIQQAKTTLHPNTFQITELPGKCLIILSQTFIIMKPLVFYNYSNCVQLQCYPGFFTSGKSHPTLFKFFLNPSPLYIFLPQISTDFLIYIFFHFPT